MLSVPESRTMEQEDNVPKVNLQLVSIRQIPQLSLLSSECSERTSVCLSVCVSVWVCGCVFGFVCVCQECLRVTTAAVSKRGHIVTDMCQALWLQRPECLTANVHVCERAHTLTHTHTHTHTHMHTHTHTRAHAHTHGCTCHAFTHARTHTHTHTHKTCAHTQTHNHTHTHPAVMR